MGIKKLNIPADPEILQDELMTAYEQASPEALKAYLKSLIGALANALKQASGLSAINANTLVNTVLIRVFSGSYEKNTASRYVGLSNKMIAFLLLSDDPEVQRFEGSLSEGLHKKYCPDCRVSELLEAQTVEGLQKVISLFKERANNYRVEQIDERSPTLEDDVMEALIIIAEKKAIWKEGRFVEDLKTPGYLLGSTKEIRPQVMDLTGLNYNQVSSCLHRLNKKGKIIRDGSNVKNLRIYLPVDLAPVGVETSDSDLASELPESLLTSQQPDFLNAIKQKNVPELRKYASKLEQVLQFLKTGEDVYTQRIQELEQEIERLRKHREQVKRLQRLELDEDDLHTQLDILEYAIKQLED